MMGLLQKAVETYDYMKALVGIERDGKTTLAPISHISVSASIMITLNAEGKFVQAQSIDDKIVIPVTIESANRTGDNCVSHVLCEQLRYILKKNPPKYDAYIKQLRDWCSSGYGDPKLNAVLQYVLNNNIEDDLTQANLLKYDKGVLKNEKAVVCWRVLGCGETEKIWADRQIHQKYIDYYAKKLKEKKTDLCYISGTEDVLLQYHLKGVVPKHGNAKLISANDTSNFTYLGRFNDSNEATTIGYTDSQKAHNALKWIVENDSVLAGERSFICWNPKGIELPNPTRALYIRNENSTPKPTEYHNEIAKKINGFKSDLKITDSVVVAVFDAANSGRLAVSYYSEFGAHDFLDRLAEWDETCCGYSKRFGISSPSLISIADAAYGVRMTEVKNGKEVEYLKTDKKILGPLVQRLLLCRIDGAKFPSDIMQAAVQKCGNLQAYTIYTRESLLFTTCSVIRKFYIDRSREVFNMALEPDRKDHSYQYGRLLAVLEKAEYDTYETDEKGKRETNAIRLQSVFIKRPLYATRLIIEQLKKGYYQKLSVRSRVNYERLIGEIMARISDCGNESGKPLSETYLMGYYLQKNALYEKQNNKEIESNTKEEF